MRTLRASLKGLEEIRQARKRLATDKGWALDSTCWLEEASRFLPVVKIGQNTVPGTVSIGTWKRFLAGKAVRVQNFKAFCTVLGLKWEEIAEAEAEVAQLTEAYMTVSSQQSRFVLPEKLPPIRSWFGRTEELNTLKAQLLNPETRAITITAVCVVGLAGVGKTTLAAKLLHQLHSDNVPFSIVAWESLRSVTGKPPRFDSIVDSLLSVLSKGTITPTITILDDYLKKTERLITLLRKSPCLLVLDNVETVLKAKQAKRAGYFADDCAEYAWLFQQLVETEHQSKVVFTSRETIVQLQQRETRTLQLGGLDQEAAINLLKSFSLMATSEELAVLSERYEGHPKALELVASVIGEDFQGQVKKFLQDRKWLLIRDIESLIDEVINRLSDEEITCLSHISVYQIQEQPLGYEGISAQMPEVNERELKENIILALKRRQLIDLNQRDGFYQMHPLVQEKASYLLTSDTYRLAHDQAYQFFLNLVKPESEWKIFDDVKPLIQAYYHACQAQNWDKAAVAVVRAYEFLRQGSFFELLVDLYTELLPEKWADGAQLVTSPQLHIDVLCNIGHASHYLRDYTIAQSYLEQALLLSQGEQDRQGEAKSLCYLGLNNIDTPNVALSYLQRCLEVATEIKSEKIRYRALEYLGVVYFNLGNQSTAADLFEQSLNVARQIGFEEGEGLALGNLGNVYGELRQYERSIEYRKQYLEMAYRVGDSKCIEYALNSLSTGYICIGDYNNALDCGEKCLRLAREAGDREIEALVMRNFGLAYRGLQDYQKAINAFQRSLKLTHQIDSKRTRAITLCELGVTYQQLERLPDAWKCFQESASIFDKIGNQARKASVLIEMVKIGENVKSVSQKNLQKYLDEAEKICQELQLSCYTELQRIKKVLYETENRD